MHQILDENGAPKYSKQDYLTSTQIQNYWSMIARCRRENIGGSQCEQRVEGLFSNPEGEEGDIVTAPDQFPLTHYDLHPILEAPGDATDIVEEAIEEVIRLHDEEPIAEGTTDMVSDNN